MNGFPGRLPRAGMVLLGTPMPVLPDEAGETGEASLAIQLSNPVAALISVPLALNHDQDIGPGDDDRADVNATFLQSFLTYTTPTQWTFALNTESTYDWENEQWWVPVNANVSRLMRIGTQLVSLGGGVPYWADSPDGGAEGFGLRITVTL